jgi:CRP/FNR family transcriptional regulator
MFKAKDSENDRLFAAMKNCPLFNGLTSQELKEVLSISHVRDYSAEEKIFTEGTVGLCFYLIVTGSVVLYAENDGKQAPLKEYSEGAFFSEIHLFSETYHSVTCAAKEVTKAIVLAKPDFEDLVKIKPKLSNKILLRFLDFFGQRLEKLYKENRELKQNYPV